MAIPTLAALPTRRPILSLTLLALAALASPRAAVAEPIGWIERYALAPDRSAVLAELIPGSEEYFFFHALHYQVTGELERAEAILSDWEKARQEGHVSGQPQDIQAIRDRQRLLTYGASPERTIEYLKNRLNIRHNHAAPPAAGERRWPERLDTAQLEIDRVIDEAVRHSQELTPLGLSRLADRLLAGQGNAPVDLEWLTQKIDGPWYPRLADLVIAELKARTQTPFAPEFGDRAAHAHLTLDELQRVAREVPQVAHHDRLVSEILLRLRPDADSDPSQQPEVRLAYLQRAENYVRTLPEAYNSLKAAMLYQLLEANRARGRYDRELFLRYLRLPRQSPIIFVPRNERLRNPADLNQDFAERALIPPIVDEEPLVRAYLEHFLRDAETPDAFRGLLRPEYLNRVFAETKLLYGVGPADRWYRMLDAQQRQALNERVELSLSETNPRIRDLSTPAVLELDVKHVDELVVRVYEINTHAYYRTHTQPIDTDIDLDGLVATAEKRIPYTLPAVRRHRESIEIPGVEGRGVWIVDLLGGGLRARALIRRGDLRYAQQWTVDGHRFTILDQDRKPVAGARMLVAGQEWTADEEGQITIPPVDQTQTRQAILLDDVLAVPVQFEHRSESYSLAAAMKLNREQLQAGQMVELVVRPRLMLGDTPVAPSMLKQPAITVTATDRDGIATTRRFSDIELDQAGETVVRFRASGRLAKVTATVSGKLAQIATDREVEVSDSQSWDVNGIDATSLVSDLHLTRSGEEWITEVRGLNGEPVPGAVVRVSLQTVYRAHPVEATLETDDAGRLVLGPLPGVVRVTLQSDQGMVQSRSLELSDAVWPTRVHTTSDAPIRLPLREAQEPSETSEEVDDQYRLLALRWDRPHEDVTEDGLKIEAGMVVIGPLPAGDYRLLDRRDGQFHTTQIAVTEGPVIGSVAAGKIRNLELQWGEPVGIRSIESEAADGNDQDEEEDEKKETLVIQLSGDASLARVHVFGSRYLPSYDSLQLPAPLPTVGGVELAHSGYISGLRLGDEYLYVLRRQYAKKYPGVMLPQPSLLIAPWITDETRNVTQEAAEGEAPRPSASPAAPMGGDRMDALSRQLREEGPTTQNLSFLPDGGVVLANLRADADGQVRIPADKLGDAALLRIVVVDPFSTVERTVVRELKPLEPRDLRLADALPADKPLAFERGVLIAGPDRPLDMKTVGTAQIQLYTQVADLLQLYRTISGDARLDEFRDLGRWHTLDEAAKRAAYGRLASHELHVFLKGHDPKFFADVVRPYLENKKEKKLVDAWLLDQDLTGWTELWQYSQLNAFEKAILARAVPDVREAVLRELRERIALDDVDPEVLRRLVDVGLAGKALEENVVLGLQQRFSQEFSQTWNYNARGAYGMPAMEGLSAMGGMGGALGDSARQPPGAAEPARDEAKAADAPAEAALEMEKAASGRRMNRLRERQAGRKMYFFQQVDSTKQWADNHWDHVRVAAANETLIRINPFWLDWATADGSQPFLSEHLLRPSGNRHEALVALALIGLPLESEGVELPSEADAMFTPPHPVAIISKRLQSLAPLSGDPSLLVGQRFEAADAQPPQPGDETEVKIAPDEFLTGRAYRGQIVLTNPTPQPRTVDVLWQIPEGSLPVAGSQATDSRTLRVEPFAVAQIQFQFYFPEPGTFTHYPVCISRDGKAIARGPERTFTVVDQPSSVDETSWEQIARHGSAERIAAFLKDANLRRLDLSLVTHRLRERPVYDAVLGVLDSARVWAPELWAYSFLYRDQPRMESYLELRQDLVASVGPVFESPLLSVEPIERKVYEHLEYAPLVRARIHSLREEPEILNDRFLAQYRALMRILAYQRTPRPEQQMALVYYMLLQNRIEEALERFESLGTNGADAEGLELDVQYQYMAAYLALHRGDYASAEELASRGSEHPVPRWNERFAELRSQLRQHRLLQSDTQVIGEEEDSPADGSSEAAGENVADLQTIDRERRQAEGAAQSPDVRVRVEGDRLVIDHRNTREVTLRFYGVDLELLFSKTPFVREGLERMATVRPGKIIRVETAAGDGTSEYRLDDALSRQTLLVEAVAGSARDTTLYYGGRLTTYVSEGFGQLQTKDRSGGAAVVGAYVKVYARYHDGSVKFYKDGYTDLRGRFDYSTLSTSELSDVERMAILVLDPERGATLHDVAPPK
ncbi:hypothetical protein [Candidatus Laterigemmans baculatus]|uniref:hypothetical protein n=1 Tax=Candidatus Laterigemmans baculatus TaxID=2770505 RepID=UPI0013DAC67D|nr:hypothetical protein [Candidatus Laterigemmans baculatus]